MVDIAGVGVPLAFSVSGKLLNPLINRIVTITKNFLIPNISSAKVEKPKLRIPYLFLACQQDNHVKRRILTDRF